MFRFSSLYCAVLILLIGIEHDFVSTLDQQCPFPNCRCSWQNSYYGYSIVCDQTTGVARGNSNITLIWYLKIADISSFPINTFSNLSISYLYIYNYNNPTLPSNLFNGIVSLTSLTLSNMPRLNRIESGCFNQIPNIKYLQIFYINLNTNNTPLIGDINREIQNLTVLYSLDMSKNEMTSLSLLSIPSGLRKFICNNNSFSILNDTNFRPLLQKNPIGEHNYLIMDYDTIQYINPDTFQSFSNSLVNNRIDLSLRDNLIEDISFLAPLNRSLYSINLSNNRIRQLNNNIDFSIFTQLEMINFENNLITHLDSSTFLKNRIYSLSLGGNYLTRPPSFSIQPYLMSLNNQNGKLIKLPDWSFNVSNRYRSESTIDLRMNEISKLDDKFLCGMDLSDVSIYIFMQTFNLTHKCQLKQPKFTSRMFIFSNEPLSCEILAFAKYLNITVNVRNDAYNYMPQTCNTTFEVVDDCQNYDQFICRVNNSSNNNNNNNNNISQIVRNTTFVNAGDPQIFSYNRQVQVCANISNQSGGGGVFTLFQSPQLIITGTGTKLAGNNTFSLAQLTSVTIKFIINNVVNTIYYANYPSRFDKVFGGIPNKTNLTDSLSNMFVSFVRRSPASANNVSQLFDFRTLTSITIIRFGSYFTLMVRAPSAFYMNSSGILVNGCPSQTTGDNSTNVVSSPICSQMCQNVSSIQLQISELNASTIYNLCTKYCMTLTGNMTTKVTNMYDQLIRYAIDQKNDDSQLAVIMRNNTVGNCDPNVNLNCNCTLGYKSMYCNMRANMCFLNPCKNKGICMNSVTPGLYVRISFFFDKFLRFLFWV